MNTEAKPVFSTTHWSVVLAAGHASSPDANAALEQLCRTYWYPLYAYLRRRGFSEHEAEDFTQGFFAQLLARRSLSGLDRAQGKFRSFLLASLNYFLADERDRARAHKRGGGCAHISFDAVAAEQRYRLEPVDERSPDLLFERRWALTLLDEVMGRLAREFAEVGKRALFHQLQPFLVDGTPGKTRAEVARELGMSEEAVKKSVQRLRKRYHQLFRQEITRTVSSAAEVEEELRHLCDVVSR